jgi:hypothetical protein
METTCVCAASGTRPLTEAPTPGPLTKCCHGGGTLLSKGHGIIHRFSEDIDIRIEPPPELHVKTGRNHSKQAHVESRRNFCDWPAKTIRIGSIEKVAHVCLEA